MQNIAQVEFFLVDLRASSLNVLLSELAERRRDNSPIKLCVRFFDNDGAMLRFAEEAQRLDTLSTAILAKFMTARGVRRWWLNKRSQWIAGARLRLRTKATAAAVHRAQQVLRARLPAAVELGDHRYAPVDDNERHELMESVRRVEKAWLFVFRPGQLCFEKNSLVASLM